MEIKEKLNRLLFKQVNPEPLAFFRIVFGILMLFSTIRFIAKGWVSEFYIEPSYFLKYPYFHWVQNPGEIGIYILFSTLIISSVFVTIGYKYRLSIIAFFISFMYIELIDITYYLNHYYFISLTAFLLIFMPAANCFSVDALSKGEAKEIANWPIFLIKFQVAIVYIFAGLAKLNYDWLIEAMPLAIWLPAHNNLPFVGKFMTLEITAYLFSWFGAIYDLFIVFFLVYPKTRKVAYFFVIVFHLSTWLLFNIGVFPFVMIALTTIYFDSSFQVKIINRLKHAIGYNTKQLHNKNTHSYKQRMQRIVSISILIFTLSQIAIPLRFLLYDGNLFWYEEGYRFSWRVMLMEKSGTAFFTVQDNTTGKKYEVVNSDYLTRNQEKQMNTQPDLILQFVEIIENDFRNKGFENISIYADSFVKLNDNYSKRYIDNSVDLTTVKFADDLDKWVLPY
ncbi:MAG: HTTM domain-containing protein [Chlorobiota bacterium]